MTDHDIQTRIEALTQERDAFQRQAEQQLAFFQGGIAALEALLKPADAEARVANQTFEGTADARG